MHKSIVICDELSEQYLQDIEKFLLEWESHNESIVVHTSGSTGVPKKMILSKERVRASARATGEFFGFRKRDALLLNLSPNYIAGKLMIVRALEFGMKIFLAPNQENPLLSFTDLKVDFAAFVPYQVKAILGDEKTRKMYEEIPAVIIGGAPISVQLETEIRQLNNNNYATFGMTETITHFALRNISNNENHYTCLPGVSVGIDDRNCLVIHENNITDELVTNDVVTLKNSKQFVWKGRFDNVINSGGVKLHLEIIERKLAGFFPNNRFYCVGIPSDKFDEELVLIVEGEEAQNSSELFLEFKTVLSKYEVPKKIFFKKPFFETPTGKIIRKPPTAFYEGT